MIFAKIHIKGSLSHSYEHFTEKGGEGRWQKITQKTRNAKGIANAWNFVRMSMGAWLPEKCLGVTDFTNNTRITVKRAIL